MYMTYTSASYQLAPEYTFLKDLGYSILITHCEAEDSLRYNWYIGFTDPIVHVLNQRAILSTDRGIIAAGRSMSVDDCFVDCLNACLNNKYQVA